MSVAYHQDNDSDMKRGEVSSEDLSKMKTTSRTWGVEKKIEKEKILPLSARERDTFIDSCSLSS